MLPQWTGKVLDVSRFCISYGNSSQLVFPVFKDNFDGDGDGDGDGECDVAQTY